MPENICSMHHVTKVTASKQVILDNITLSYFDGAKIGVLGLNGSGKSTLLRILAGEDQAYNGEVTIRKGVKVGYLPQEPRLDPTLDVRGNVMKALSDVAALLARFNEISDAFAEPLSADEMQALLDEQGELQSAIDAAGGWELDRKLEVAADALRLPPWDAPVDTLSGGESRRVALCQLLLSEPDMLLLDEPTNHLDAESVAWLERYLQDYAGTVIAVTHDRYFLDNIAGWILELDRGRAYPFEGNYTQWLVQKEARLAQEEKAQAAKQKAIEEELNWVRKQSKGQQDKSKSRLSRFEALCEDTFQSRNETRSLYIPPGPRLGDKVINVSALSKHFGDKCLIEQLDIQVPPGAIVGIIGPNGAGKSTFFKMLSGKETPCSGEIEVGDTVQMAYVDQVRDGLQDNQTVWQAISDGLDHITVGKYTTPSRAYVGRFNFRGSDQQKYLKDLSGGERNRVHLAKLLRAGGNVLLLDEPTNDLDVETLRALEGAILNFPGTVFVISHDRWFLDRISTHTLAFEGDSQVSWFQGNYSAYAADKKTRLGKDDLGPKRIKYRKLTV